MKNTIAAAAVAALLSTTACGGPPSWQCDSTSFCAFGNIRVEGVPLDGQTEDFRARLEHEMTISATYWGHSMSELAGWRIVYYPLKEAQTTGLPGCPFSIPNRCTGLTMYSERTIYLRLSWPLCLEAQPLPHELEHAFVAVAQFNQHMTITGDGMHDDERWAHVMDLGAQIIDVQPSCSFIAGQNIGWNHPLHSQ